MRCPECNSRNSSDATFCSSCGLILFKLAPPHRRREDLAVERRRASDAKAACPLCKGEVAVDAVRCTHCAQIIREDVHRELLLRRRSQINYASWIAYIFGLLVFLIFKPVGLLSIGAGLLLSIVYYAIPVSDEPLKKRSWKEFFRDQFRMERIAIPFPAMGKRKLVFIGTPIMAALIGFFANFVLLQQPMNRILDQNDAFKGMSVSAHYEYWVVPGVIVYNLRSADEQRDPLVVHTALLEYASVLRKKSFKEIELQYRGEPRLRVDGEVFRRVGVEYAKRNYRFGLFEFPAHVRTADNRALRAKDSHEKLLELHRVWYAEAARKNNAALVQKRASLGTDSRL